MKLLIKAIPFLVFLSLAFLFAVNPSDLLMVGCLIFAGVVLVQIVISLLRLHRLSDIWPLVLIGLCGIGLAFLSLRAGFVARDAIFRSRLNDYQAAANLLSKGAPGRLDAASLPAQYPHLAKGVFVQKTEDGTTTVVFILGSTFPVRHFGYVYRSTGRIEDWTSAKLFAGKFRPVAPDWFGF